MDNNHVMTYDMYIKMWYSILKLPNNLFLMSNLFLSSGTPDHVMIASNNRLDK